MSDFLSYQLQNDQTAEAATGFEDDPGAASARRQTVTRADLLEAVSATCPALSRTQTRDIFEAALEEVATALAQGENVKLRSFGSFAVREKRGRTGRNPRTGVEAPITPRRVLTFRASPLLLEAVNGRTSGRTEDSNEDS